MEILKRNGKKCAFYLLQEPFICVFSRSIMLSYKCLVRPSMNLTLNPQKSKEKHLLWRLNEKMAVKCVLTAYCVFIISL